MRDIAETGTPLYELRVALGRLLQAFQDDLGNLESGGLAPEECEEVQRLLKEVTESFESRASTSTSIYTALAHHFNKYADVYIKWNGHEGSAPEKQPLRRQVLSELTQKRRKLFRKLSSRQDEMVTTVQLDLPFAKSIQESLASVALIDATKFPRMAQARVLFNFV